MLKLGKRFLKRRKFYVNLRIVIYKMKSNLIFLGYVFIKIILYKKGYLIMMLGNFNIVNENKKIH